jgi:hypothetical protein
LVVGCGDKKQEDGTAAGSGGGGAVVASCDQRDLPNMGFQTCNEYYGRIWTPKEVEAQCSGEKKFIAGACPQQGLVVSCKMYGGKPSELVTHYYDKPDKAKEACVRMQGELL